MSEAIKLKNWGRYGEGNAEYKGCELYFSEDRSELRIEKGDANPEVWRVGEFDKASGKAHYTNDLLGDDGITGDWSDEDWEQVDEHASRYHIASNRELWREYFDPDENYTDEDWEDEPVKDRVKTMEGDAKQEKREYVVKLTDEEIEALKKSHVNGPLYHLVKQILDQHSQ